MPEVAVQGGVWWEPEGGGPPLPAVPGAYVLEMRLDAPLALEVGRLGRAVLPAGELRYLGSARGPGGLRARVGRHLRPARRRDRWHVDLLTRRIPVRRVLLVPGGDECGLVHLHLERGWTAPVPGFGSSDCRSCPAHLLWRSAPLVAAAGDAGRGGENAPGWPGPFVRGTWRAEGDG